MSARRVAIVTGAATGVGAACARWFASRSFDILVNYRASEHPAREVADDCRSLGADILVQRGDVSKDADCRDLAAAAAERWGRVDVLVNSAGATVFRPMTDLEALDMADFLGIYGVNTVGPYQMTRAVVPHMSAGGAIVNVSSIAGLNGTGSSYAYAASKAALNCLTIALARNLAPAIRVNAVLPGMIEGRWLREGVGEDAYESIRANFAKNAALQRVATSEDIAETVGWLATSAALLTGQLITADSGLLVGQPPKVL